jgi:RNA polymerase II-associated factor 1
MSQYYIARIRYQNPLPPPPFPPKLVNIPTPIDPYTTPEYTSTLAQSQPPNIDIDVEGGMPLDLSIIPGLFEGDESGDYSLSLRIRNSCTGLYADPMRADLHPRDRALLKTPETATTPSRSHSHIAVPFLRRTEYIAAEKHSTPTNTGNILRGTRRPSLQVAQKELDHVFEDPEAQQQMVEQMFKDVDVDWVGRKHPKKRGVECVDSWEVLPDRGRLGQLLLLMRFQDDHISNSPVYPHLQKALCILSGG